MTHEELVATAVRLAGERATPDMSPEDKDDLLEETMLSLLDKQAMTPFFAKVGLTAAGGFSGSRGLYLMHEEPRLPTMPEAPTLLDFFKKRVLLNKRGGTHLLQSAALAKKNGLPDKLVLACLVHDIAVVGHVRSDHGYYGAQLIEPYVDEEVTWAVRYHQALRFFPDADYGYEYPDLYVRAFGENYKPPAYIVEAAEYARSHKWYIPRVSSRRTISTRSTRTCMWTSTSSTALSSAACAQPKEGLGFDGSPSAHMWRSIIWPNNFL